MKKLLLAAAAMLITLPVTAEDAGLSIPAEQKALALDGGGGEKKNPGGPKAKKKAVKKKERGSGYKFKAQDSNQYKFDGGAKPLTGGKRPAPKKKGKTKEESGYKFRRGGSGSSYRLDDEANPLGRGGAKKAPAPKKPASAPAKKAAPPPYDDSLPVDRKVISLEGE